MVFFLEDIFLARAAFKGEPGNQQGGMAVAYKGAP